MSHGFSSAWIKVGVGFAQHPKTLELAQILGEPLAGFYVLSAWAWFGTYFPEGEILAAKGAALEAAAGWRGEPGKLIKALIQARFLDRKGGKLRAHGWDEWQSKHIEKAAKDRARMRTLRAKSRESQEMSRATVSLPSQDGPPTVTGRGEERREEEKTPPTPLAEPSIASQLRAVLEEVYKDEKEAEYRFQPRDGAALAEVEKLCRGNLLEAREQFRRGLNHTDWPSCNGIHDLAYNWNAYNEKVKRRSGSDYSL